MSDQVIGKHYVRMFSTMDCACPTNEHHFLIEPLGPDKATWDHIEICEVEHKAAGVCMAINQLGLTVFSAASDPWRDIWDEPLRPAHGPRRPSTLSR